MAQLLHVAVGQAVAQVPTDRHRDHLARETGNPQERAELCTDSESVSIGRESVGEAEDS
jgi:hypothetical protein